MFALLCGKSLTFLIKSFPNDLIELKDCLFKVITCSIELVDADKGLCLALFSLEGLAHAISD